MARKAEQIIATGTPEKVAKVKKSYTGHYLKPIFERDRKRMEKIIAEAESVGLIGKKHEFTRV